MNGLSIKLNAVLMPHLRRHRFLVSGWIKRAETICIFSDSVKQSKNISKTFKIELLHILFQLISVVRTSLSVGDRVKIN